MSTRCNGARIKKSPNYFQQVEQELKVARIELQKQHRLVRAEEAKLEELTDRVKLLVYKREELEYRVEKNQL